MRIIRSSSSSHFMCWQIVVWVLMDISVADKEPDIMPTSQVKCPFEGCDCMPDNGKLSITCDGALDYLDAANTNAKTGGASHHHQPAAGPNKYYSASTRLSARVDNSTPAIESFTILNYNLKHHLPDDAFGSLALGSLRLADNELERITLNSLRGLHGLNKLIIEDKSFRLIEPGAFEHVKEYLNELEIVSTDLIDERLDAWHGELNRLVHLQVLILDNNHLTRVSSAWFENMSNLLKLSLTANSIGVLDADAFKDLSALRRLNLQHNKLSGKLDQTPLLPFRETLISLNLSANMISSLPIFDKFERLGYLDLSHNLVHSIHPKTFRNLDSLYVLDLSHNDIRAIFYDTFLSQTGLYYLKLHNNALESAPNIRKLTSLIDLDLHHQHGKLMQLRDYQFERENQTLLPLTVNLDENEIRFVESSRRPFCSRTSVGEVHVDTLILTSQTLTRLIDTSVCLLSQLGAAASQGQSRGSKVDLFVRKSVQSFISIQPNVNASLCNCDFLSFLKRFSLNIEANYELDCPRGLITLKELKKTCKSNSGGMGKLPPTLRPGLAFRGHQLCTEPDSEFSCSVIPSASTPTSEIVFTAPHNSNLGRVPAQSAASSFSTSSANLAILVVISSFRLL